MKSCRGFTLVELICVIILVGILATGLTFGFTHFAQQQLTLRRNYQQSQKIQVAISRLYYEIKNCTALAVAGNTVSYTFGTSKSIYAKNWYLVLNDAGTEHKLTDNVSSLNVTYGNSMLKVVFVSTLASNNSSSTTLYIYK